MQRCSGKRGQRGQRGQGVKGVSSHNRQWLGFALRDGKHNWRFRCATAGPSVAELRACDAGALSPVQLAWHHPLIWIPACAGQVDSVTTLAEEAALLHSLLGFVFDLFHERIRNVWGSSRNFSMHLRWGAFGGRVAQCGDDEKRVGRVAPRAPRTSRNAASSSDHESTNGARGAACPISNGLGNRSPRMRALINPSRPPAETFLLMPSRFPSITWPVMQRGVRVGAEIRRCIVKK